MPTCPYDRGLSSARQSVERLCAPEIPIRNLPRPSATTLLTFGQLALAWPAALLPRTAPHAGGARSYPSGQLGQTICSGCRGHLQALGRRGRIPTVRLACGAKRRAAANGRSRRIPLTDRG